MKKSILNLINNLLKPSGIGITKRKEQQIQQTYLTFLENLHLNKKFKINSQSPRSEKKELDVNIIIFSKDRALQLYALLNSFNKNVAELVKIHILYFASTAEHAKAYNQVSNLLERYDITFIREKQFREDLISLVNNLTVSKVLFLVDDIIITEPISFTDFLQYNTDNFVPSLRMGIHLNYSYTTQQTQPLPEFLQVNVKNNSDKIFWNWNQGVLDWNYPLSVDGHLFSVNEIGNMLPLIDFKAPNSLEEAMQLFKPFYLKKLGLAYKKAKIVNIPCNKVQVENSNISEEITVEYLLEKWQAGFQIDYTKFLHLKNTSAHQFVPFEFIPRQQSA